MFYPEVYKYFKKYPYEKEKYGERVHKCIENLRKQISRDPQMHNWLSCEENRYEDLYEILLEHVENLMPTGKDIHDPLFELYNYMHRQSFYNIWTNDLLSFMLRCKHK